MIPNIFKYASKELSQDALICWLVACGKDGTGRLREIGRDFVRVLMESGERMVIQDDQSTRYGGDCKVEQVLCEPRQQYKNIDVYFRAMVDGRVVSFVIEDKVHTEMHDDQLNRYRRIVTDDAIAEDVIKTVYLKTGYVFDDEREKAEANGYSVFDGKDMLHFLDSDRRAHVHEVVRQYSEYMASEVEYRRNALRTWKLDESFVQWKFMVRLGDVLQLSGIRWPARAFSIGGGAWTQYPHWKDRGALFWRLDSWKPLRLMVDTHAAGDDVLARWDGWFRSFEDARIKTGLVAAEFRSVRRRSGKLVREGTIGAVDIARSLRREGLARCVARVAQLHRTFLASLDDDLS